MCSRHFGQLKFQCCGARRKKLACGAPAPSLIRWLAVGICHDGVDPVVAVWAPGIIAKPAAIVVEATSGRVWMHPNVPRHANVIFDGPDVPCDEASQACPSETAQVRVAKTAA